MTNENSASNQEKWTELAKRAQAGAQLKQQLLNDPTPLVLQSGMKIPAGATVRVVEESGHLRCIFEAPKAAAGAEISETDLHSVVGGTKQVASPVYEIEDFSFDIEQVVSR
jgi:hypothetical protein